MRPVVEKLAANHPLLTGQRVLDSLFPYVFEFFIDKMIYSVYVDAYKVVQQPFQVPLVVEKRLFPNHFRNFRIVMLLFMSVVVNVEMKWRKYYVIFLKYEKLIELFIQSNSFIF
jgi:hypothetical protein